MWSIRRFLGAEGGATSVEYSLVALLVALAILVGVTALGVNLGALYGSLASQFPPIPAA